MFSLDAYAPNQIARRVETVGLKKAKMAPTQVLALACLAGAFIALGAVFYTVVVTGSELGFGPTRLVGGLSFCLGLVLVVLAGAELFTGNNLVAMAWASRKISTGELLRNWALVYLGNAVGALFVVGLVLLAQTANLADGGVGEVAVAVARSKCALAPEVAFARGVLCNTLVCLAVWLAMGGHTFADKFFAVLFPITAFVAAGFEHSIANLFFLPWGIALAGDTSLIAPAFANLAWVTLGNVVGGSVLVAGTYWTVYLWHGPGKGG
jgi:formate transporter